MQINDWLTLASLALQAARLVLFSLGRRPAWQATGVRNKKRGSTPRCGPPSLLLGKERWRWGVGRRPLL